MSAWYFKYFARIFILLSIILVSSIFLSSCHAKRELNQLGLVVVTGIDLDPDGKTRITVLSIQPYGRKTQQSTQSFTWVGSATGNDISEAILNLRATAARNLLWVHNKVIIIGKEKALEGLRNTIDFLARVRQLRYHTDIFITDSTAFKILQIPPDVQSSTYEQLIGISRNFEEWGKSYKTNLKDFLIDCVSFNGCSVVGKVSFFDTSRNTFSASKQEYEKLETINRQRPVLYMSGGAVVDKYKLIGWLTPEEINGFLILKNKLKINTYKTIMHKQSYTLHLLKSKSKINIDIINNRLHANINVEIIGKLFETLSHKNLKEKGFFVKLESVLAKEIISNLKLTMDKAQNKLKTDFIGFCQYFCTQHPRKWQQIKNSWGNLFTKMNISYNVKVDIINTGRISRMISNKEQ